MLPAAHFRKGAANASGANTVPTDQLAVGSTEHIGDSDVEVDLRMLAARGSTAGGHQPRDPHDPRLMSRDCSDPLTADPLPGKPIHVQVGTIVRSEQSAIVDRSAGRRRPC